PHPASFSQAELCRSKLPPRRSWPGAAIIVANRYRTGWPDLQSVEKMGIYCRLVLICAERGNAGATGMPISGDGAPEAAARKPVATRKSQGSARLTNGSELLPDVDGRSVWARLLRDTMGAMYRHLGGEDRVSETQRLAIRRVGALEAEMIFLEAKFAKARS